MTAPAETDIPEPEAPAAQEVRDFPPALPLRDICHIASATVEGHPEWLAAYHAPHNELEAWYIADREARRQARLAERPSDEEIAASIREAIADLPAEPSRTTGPMSGVRGDPMGELDPERTEALHRYDAAHDGYQDVPDRGRHGRPRGFLRRWSR